MAGRITQRDVVEFMQDMDKLKDKGSYATHHITTIQKDVRVFKEIVEDVWGDYHEEDDALYLELNT